MLASCSGELPASIERSAQYSSAESVPGDAACGPADALCGDTCARLDAAAARGHAHFVNTTTTPGSDLTIDITSTQSPFAVPR